MNKQTIIRRLKENGLIRAKKITLTPLKGGVSSDIYLVQDGASKFVVKQALPRLRVPDEWLADTSRNLVEQSFVRYASGFVPDAVLPIRAADPQEGFFIMDYLEGGFVTWKQQLLRGEFNEGTARRAAELIAAIHQHSWNDPEASRMCPSVTTVSPAATPCRTSIMSPPAGPVTTSRISTVWFGFTTNTAINAGVASILKDLHSLSIPLKPITRTFGVAGPTGGVFIGNGVRIDFASCEVDRQALSEVDHEQRFLRAMQTANRANTSFYRAATR